MPFVGEVASSPTADVRDQVYASDFRHEDETATPGRHTVALASGASADLAVTTRAGIGDFGSPQGKPAALLFRTSNSLNGSEDAETTIDPVARTVSGSVLTGAFCGRRANGGANNKKTYYRCASGSPTPARKPPAAPSTTRSAGPPPSTASPPTPAASGTTSCARSRSPAGPTTCAPPSTPRCTTRSCNRTSPAT